MEELQIDIGQQIIADYKDYNANIVKKDEILNKTFDLEGLSIYINETELLIGKGALSLSDEDDSTTFLSAFHSPDNKLEVCPLCHRPCSNYESKERDWYLTDCLYVQKKEVKEIILFELKQIVHEYALDFDLKAKLKSVRYDSVRLEADIKKATKYVVDFVCEVDVNNKIYEQAFQVYFYNSGYFGATETWDKWGYYFDINKMPTPSCDKLNREISEQVDNYLEEIEKYYLVKKEVGYLRSLECEITNIRKDKSKNDFIISFRLKQYEQDLVGYLKSEGKFSGDLFLAIDTGGTGGDGMQNVIPLHIKNSLCLHYYLVDCFIKELKKMPEYRLKTLFMNVPQSEFYEKVKKEMNV